MENKKLSNEELIALAIKARETAYAPYSNWMVGAALETKEGKVYLGCNIENGGFTATSCAERTAFFKAISEGEKEFSRIAIVGGDRELGIQGLCYPCGVCRQVMAEFCNPDDFKVIVAKSENDYKQMPLRELIPGVSFIKDNSEYGFKPNK